MGMVTFVVVALMAALAAVFQPAVAQNLSVGSVFPDAATACLVVAGLLLGPTEALAIGFLVGVISVTQIGHVGLGGLLVARSVVGLLAGFASARVFIHSVVTQMAAVLAGVLISEAILFVFSPDATVGPWMGAAGGRALLSALIAPLFFRIANGVAAWEMGDAHRPGLGPP
ncbi:MAG: hypothetical protein GF320_06375 [Armatimonadia bacterium]|nr:hypothetical protein [Armatimonadia bacterium]